MMPTAHAHGYILLIEDDPGVREGLSEIITNEGYPVVSCADGQIAMNQLASMTELPRMIVLDFAMPHMDGWAFLAERRKDARLRLIPVVGMSASQQFVDLRRPPDDVDEVLRKPFPVEDMLRSIEKHWI
ncbi:MAG TPA: response regulator [Polyangiaceae bacterium]|jgi:CheY-like chemotaxis protein|nr:response regulator [Polyangiaceae bacterium]